MGNKPSIYQSINRRRRGILLLAVAATVFACLLDLGTGSSGLTFGEILPLLWKGPSAGGSQGAIVWRIRLPMTLTCVFVGGSLGLSGLQVQTITGNPLASPYTLGITAGASFGAAIAITVGFTLFGLQWAGTAALAFLFALGVSLAIYALGKRRGLSTSTLVLTGIVMNFFFSALKEFLQYRASAEIAQIIANWSFGSLGRSTWASASVAAGILAASFLLLLGKSWQLTALTAGEERARSLGIPVDRLRLQVFVISACLIAGAVGFIGTVAFVGLVAPHCARMLAGEDQRYLMPLSTVLGSFLLLLSSTVAKWISTGAMMPVGILTSIVGVPFLFVLLLREEG